MGIVAHNCVITCGSQEQLTRSVKQARTTMTEDDTLQGVSFLFQKGNGENQRNGFLHIRMDGMRHSN